MTIATRRTFTIARHNEFIVGRRRWKTIVIRLDDYGILMLNYILRMNGRILCQCLGNERLPAKFARTHQMIVTYIWNQWNTTCLIR
jgi:hypothetical protein